MEKTVQLHDIKNIADGIISKCNITALSAKAKLQKHIKLVLENMIFNSGGGEYLFGGEFFDNGLNKFFSCPQLLGLNDSCKSFLLAAGNAQYSSLPAVNLTVNGVERDFSHIIADNAVKYRCETQFKQLAYFLQRQHNILFTAAFIIDGTGGQTPDDLPKKIERFMQLKPGRHGCCLIMGIYPGNRHNSANSCGKNAGSCNNGCSGCKQQCK